VNGYNRRKESRTSGPLEACSTRTFGKSKGNIMSDQLGMAECMDKELLLPNSNLDMHYSTSPSYYPINLSSVLLRATSDYQLFFSFNNVFMWVS
jgi:hypothetical protein